MAGIRLTLDRQFPELFVKYPLPWKFSYYSQGMGIVVKDAHDRRMVAGDAGLMRYWLGDLYAYAVPWAGITGLQQTRMPDILREHPLPWRIHTLTHRTPYPTPGRAAVTLRDAMNEWIVDWAEDATRYPSGAITGELMFQLSQLAYKRYAHDTGGIQLTGSYQEY
jgi:hypothetical protein